MENKVAKPKEISAAKLARIKAIADALTAMGTGKASPEQSMLVSSVSASELREAHKAMGRVSERGSRSAVSVKCNGTNGHAVGWREWYGLKGLATHARGVIVVEITPEGVENPKAVTSAKISELFKRLENIKDGETPAELAKEIALAK